MICVLPQTATVALSVTFIVDCLGGQDGDTVTATNAAGKTFSGVVRDGVAVIHATPGAWIISDGTDMTAATATAGEYRVEVGRKMTSPTGMTDSASLSEWTFDGTTPASIWKGFNGKFEKGTSGTASLYQKTFSAVKATPFDVKSIVLYWYGDTQNGGHRPLTGNVYYTLNGVDWTLSGDYAIQWQSTPTSTYEPIAGVISLPRRLTVRGLKFANWTPNTYCNTNGVMLAEVKWYNFDISAQSPTSPTGLTAADSDPEWTVAGSVGADSGSFRGANWSFWRVFDGVKEKYSSQIYSSGGQSHSWYPRSAANAFVSAVKNKKFIVRQIALWVGNAPNNSPDRCEVFIDRDNGNGWESLGVKDIVYDVAPAASTLSIGHIDIDPCWVSGVKLASFAGSAADIATYGPLITEIEWYECAMF